MNTTTLGNDPEDRFTTRKHPTSPFILFGIDGDTEGEFDVGIDGDDGGFDEYKDISGRYPQRSKRWDGQ